MRRVGSAIDSRRVACSDRSYCDVIFQPPPALPTYTHVHTDPISHRTLHLISRKSRGIEPFIRVTRSLPECDRLARSPRAVLSLNLHVLPDNPAILDIGAYCRSDVGGGGGRGETRLLGHASCDITRRAFFGASCKNAITSRFRRPERRYSSPDRRNPPSHSACAFEK